MDAILKILESIFRDGATGSLLISRAVIASVIFFIAFLWFKGENLMTTYKDSRYVKYQELSNEAKQKRFISSYQDQLNYVFAASGSELTAIYTFRPDDLNYFVDMLAYKGRLPSAVDPQNLGGFPIDKSSLQYQTEVTGGYFQSTDTYEFLPTRNKQVKEITFMFSCPYFDLANSYSGSIEMYWYDGVNHDLDKKRLVGICSQAARTIGRTR